MTTPILSTKLFTPPPRPQLVAREQLLARLDGGLAGKLTLVSAPAGFGKTTLVATWVAGLDRPVSWLSLDEGDCDLNHFLTYLVAALRKLSPDVGNGLLAALNSPQPLPIELTLIGLINELSALPQPSLLVLDDYHTLDSVAVDQALSFLVEHLPPQLHLVITTREDPPLPLARLRARSQLSELRLADLRFTAPETTHFLNQVMGLQLTAAEIEALAGRTEGWIAGLQLAALSLQRQSDSATFIQSFSGSHHFVLDYLVSEVLEGQPADVQRFLLHTAILERLCGPLCDALLPELDGAGQATLEALAAANLFIVPLDNDRHWYRYHHLFADLLRQRLGQKAATLPAELHRRASRWHEENGLEIEAFRHAAAADDIARAERLIEGGGMPLHFRGGVTPVLNWLATLPPASLDEHPSLWTAYASVLLVTGQNDAVEPTLAAAEAALARQPASAATDDLRGRLAAIRATLAAARQQIPAIITHSQQALELLKPDNLAFRTSTNWKLGFAYQLQGDQAAARQAYSEVVATGQVTGNVIFTAMALLGLAMIAFDAGDLLQARARYSESLALLGEQPLPMRAEAHLGLGNIDYAQEKFAAAEEHAHRALAQLASYGEPERHLTGRLLLGAARLAQEDHAGALETLAAAEAQLAHQPGTEARLGRAASGYLATLRAAAGKQGAGHTGGNLALIEPLSERELEVLQLVAAGLSNRQIGERLFLALSTVKGHNRNIYDKLQVQRRTEAIARARELGIL